MNLSQENLEKMIGKLIKVIKPEGVSDIEFKIRPVDMTGNEYSMSITYIIPDKSEIINNQISADKYRSKWNDEISNNIKNYFGPKIFIGSSGFTRESYHNYLKKNS
jgi:stalled ribosome rescue protein Dom34